MKRDRPSRTAAWVAALRGLPELLPPEARLVHDPFGLRFGDGFAKAIARAATTRPELTHHAVARLPILQQNALWLMVRTRVLDDAVRRFVAAGGRQLLLLGAGFDCRAARLRDELLDTVVFEVDHPATQAEKKAVLAEAGAASVPVVYLAWDFERDPLAALPDRLSAIGHDRGRPTLTIWEGVTPYLTEPAIEASIAAVRALSAPGSQLAMTYFDRTFAARLPPSLRIVRRMVALAGEPFRFGWDPAELPAWLAARGFTLASDRADTALAAELISPTLARKVGVGQRRIAIATRA